MSEIKVNSIKGVGASAAAITVNNTDGTCTANITNNLSNRNLIINGAMQVAQRGVSLTGVGASNNIYLCDRWKTINNQTSGRYTMTQEADAPSGFANSLKLDCTTVDTSIAAGENLLLRQSLEGQDLQRIKKGTADAESLTLSFYVKANAAFTFGIELQDADNSRQITKLFNTTTNWVKHSITFPADTTGVFDDDNLASLHVSFWLHAGSTYTSGTLNSTSFASLTNANRAVGVDSFFSSTDNNFFITGVQLEVGSVATDFEHRSFGQELALCQRYYFKYVQGSNKNICTGAYFNSGTLTMSVQFPVEMRAAPSLDYVSGTSYYLAYREGGSDAFDSMTIQNAHVNGAGLDSAAGASGTQGVGASAVTNNASSYIAFSSEL